MSEKYNFDQVNRTPFKEKLKETTYDSRMVKIRQLESRPDILVREYELQAGENLDESIKLHEEAKSFFGKMSAEYGIKVVSMDFVTGKNEAGRPAIFTVVDKIEGNNLSEVKELPIAARGELSELYLSLTLHYYNAWKQNDRYWADGNDTQFVYGHKYGEKNDHFFLVDVDGRFCKPGENENFPIEWKILNMSEGLIKAENKLGPKVKLEEVRNMLNKVISEMQQTADKNKSLLKAKNLLKK